MLTGSSRRRAPLCPAAPDRDDARSHLAALRGVRARLPPWSQSVRRKPPTARDMETAEPAGCPRGGPGSAKAPQAVNNQPVADEVWKLVRQSLSSLTAGAGHQMAVAALGPSHLYGGGGKCVERADRGRHMGGVQGHPELTPRIASQQNVTGEVDVVCQNAVSS